jgi:hypothetical protein
LHQFIIKKDKQLNHDYFSNNLQTLAMAPNATWKTGCNFATPSRALDIWIQGPHGCIYCGKLIVREMCSKRETYAVIGSVRPDFSIQVKYLWLILTKNKFTYINQFYLQNVAFLNILRTKFEEKNCQESTICIYIMYMSLYINTA